MMGIFQKNKKMEKKAGWHATHNQLNGTNKHLTSKKTE
jgi:hypothetical protein